MGTITQKTRVGISLVESSSAKEPMELDYRILVAGDFSHSKKGYHKDGKRLKDRKIRKITNRNGFKAVFKELNPRIKIRVPDRLSGEKDKFFDIELEFSELGDFHPDKIIEKVEALRRLQQARTRLKRFKTMQSDDPEFKEIFSLILQNDEMRKSLLDKLGTQDEVGKPQDDNDKKEE